MNLTTVIGFEWDDSNRDKCQKHGVTIAEIEVMFGEPHRIAPDIAHSTSETRFLAIGTGGRNRPIFVAFTLRESGDGLRVRPISARYMHSKEIEYYEKTTSPPDQ